LVLPHSNATDGGEHGARSQCWAATSVGATTGRGVTRHRCPAVTLASRSRSRLRRRPPTMHRTK
jgi:hypothetical protein